MEKAKTFFTARNIAILGILLALVVVLQAFGLSIPMPGGTSMTFVLVPIVIGGMLLGPIAGTFLGLAFGVVSLFDSSALMLMNYMPAATVITVLLKGMLAGLVSSLLFKIISRKNKYVATFVAAASAPIANTGTFFIGCLFMRDVLVSLVGTTFWAFIGLIMINFAIELAINIILAPAIYTVFNTVEKRLNVRKGSKIKEKEKV